MIRRILAALTAVPLTAVPLTVVPLAACTSSTPHTPHPAQVVIVRGIGAGQHQVGADIAAGEYTTTAPAGAGCTWLRLSDDTGEITSVIAYGRVEPGQRGYLVVHAADRYVRLDGDCRWTVVQP